MGAGVIDLGPSMSVPGLPLRSRARRRLILGAVAFRFVFFVLRVFAPLRFVADGLQVGIEQAVESAGQIAAAGSGRTLPRQQPRALGLRALGPRQHFQHPLVVFGAIPTQFSLSKQLDILLKWIENVRIAILFGQLALRLRCVLQVLLSTGQVCRTEVVVAGELVRGPLLRIGFTFLIRDRLADVADVAVIFRGVARLCCLKCRVPFRA